MTSLADEDVWRAWKITMEFGATLAREASARFANAVYCGGALGDTPEQGRSAIEALARYLLYRHLVEVAPGETDEALSGLARSAPARARVLAGVAGFLSQDAAVQRLPQAPTRKHLDTPQSVRGYVARAFAASVPTGEMAPAVLTALGQVAEPIEAEHLALWLTGTVPPLDGDIFRPGRHRGPRSGFVLEARVAAALEDGHVPTYEELPKAARPLYQFLRTTVAKAGEKRS